MSDLKGPVTLKRLPMPENPTLAMGARIWGKNCVICHGSGNFGAPKITARAQWEPRIAKGLDTLFDHALNGFVSADGGSMPARGGKKKLSDEEVTGAVRFMISLSGGADLALQGFENTE
jgi:cytochrome c5